MKVTLLATVGTSILINLDRLAGSIPSEFESILKNAGRLPIDDPKQDLFRRRIHASDKLMRFIVDVISQNPELMSAELNTMIKFLRSWKPNTTYIDEMHIRLYPTDTGTSIFCAYAIKNYVEQMQEQFKMLTELKPDCRITCDVVELKGFGVSEKFFVEGIDELLDKYARYIISQKKQKRKVILIASGGFKPEVTYAVIIGLLAGVDKIVYIHEAFRYYVELPRIPIDINAEVKALVDKIGYGTYPKHALESAGIDVDYWKELGVLEEKDGAYRVAEWLVKIVKARETL